MSVAVLIVNYRAYDALDRCLASLQPYLGPDDEVAVVDWESDTARCEQLAGQHPRVRWLARPDNRGFAAGVNLAAAHTTAPVLLLLNPDSEVEGPIVQTLGTWLLEAPERGVVGPLVLNSDGSVQASARRFPGLSTILGGRSTWLTKRFPNNWFSTRNLLSGADELGEGREVDWVAGSCLATRRDVFMRLGGFDETYFMYWEDADFCRRATTMGFLCHYVPIAGVRHAGGRSSSQNVVPSIRAFHRSAFHLYWKHARLGRVFAPLVWTGLRLREQFKLLLRPRAG